MVPFISLSVGLYARSAKSFAHPNADEVTFLPHLIIDDTGSGAVNFQVTRKTCLQRLLMPSIGDRYPAHRGKPEHLRVAQKGNC